MNRRATQYPDRSSHAAAGSWLEFAVHHRQGGLSLAAQATLRGRSAVLVGGSGAGKTSLLRAIAGLLRPQQARITVLGVVVADTTQQVWREPAARRCGLVMQRPALFPNMTAAENVAFGLQGLPTVERARRVEEMASLFRLGLFLRRRPAQLSGGEQQRVALARALAPYPAFLLLDEPFAGLDFALKEAILNDLDAWLSQRPTPVLQVTHDIAEAWRHCSRPGAEALRIEAGRIVAHGSAAEVLAADRARLLAALE